MILTYDDEQKALELARDWKAGRLARVHPSIGRRLNSVLVAAGEDPVPHKRGTDGRRPSMVDLIRREYERAPDSRNRSRTAASRRFMDDLRTGVQERAT